ncbi:sigma-54-dependent transcriptional regulator [Solilutibacter silvestris]|uniref:Response regulator containing CheY-like receiver AAA-type ATPase n=1 Tax=Solilutibacter silvestris TaxID=1645665 RepID=A0A2K1Q1E3_9GAMM|nr:sigma-54 dependent transcriptional regulator [Lysobacter silvestris]PNS08852.1 Response regulator containing CheY-like receiver AAA-type ATPase [Lysobacter silvestris]
MHSSRPTSNPQRILVVDDQSDVRDALRLLLKAAGYIPIGAASPQEAIARLQTESIEAVLADMNFSIDTTSGSEGLELIKQLNEHWPGLPVIAMTAWASIDLAVEAMRCGAVDFIEKPWQNARVLSVLKGNLDLTRSQREAKKMSAANALLLSEGEFGFIARSSTMQRAVDDLRRVVDSDAAILLLGENGTGKSLLAQLVHHWSARRSQPFVKVDIGSLAPNLLETELFGHSKGAYTDARQERVGRFELADEGTLFLDEIANLPFEQQPKLLRAIEDGEFERVGSSKTQKVDVRIITATNANLDAMVSSGRFRQDLLYRLNTFQITIPPLRERRDDILPLARHYLAGACKRYRRTVPELDSDAQRVLCNYAWPGNVRELAHVMERAALFASGSTLSAFDLRLQQAVVPEDSDLGEVTLEQAEKIVMKRSLERHRWNLQRSADELGITRQALYRRLGKYSLRKDDAED